MEINTEVLIKATPQTVWDILTSFEKYPAWNPFIKSLKGEAKVGNEVTVTIAQTKTKETVFKPKILTMDTNRN